ncbi:hypothetical protein [Endothiovibrio diazotrophicus]
MENGDIVLLESSDMSDADNAGGRASGRVIQDGQVNSIFSHISGTSATRGSTEFRKVYPALRTPTTERLYGPHVVLSEIPDDPNVSVVMFTTGSHTDTRAEARDRVESYVIAGVESRWRLLERHLVGLRSLQLWGDRDAPLPEIGEVLCLVDEGANPQTKQFVRIAGVDSRMQSFKTAQCDEFEVQVAEIEIVDPLRIEFIGPTPTCFYAESDVKVRLTVEASATEYFGTARLVEPVTAGSTTVTVSDVRQPLAPSSQRESALVDVAALPTRGQLVQAGTAEVATPWLWGGGIAELLLPCAATPGTVKINRYNAYGSGGLYATDNGDGTASGIGPATIDYADGRIVLGSPTFADWNFEVVFLPAVSRHDPVRTAATPIESANRRYTYIFTMQPPPAPGTALLEYPAMGRWYRITDAGDGTLGGDGSGTVNYGTGSVSVSLAALPDTGGGLLWSWGAEEGYVQRTGEAAGRVRIQLTHGYELGTVVATWQAGGADQAVSQGGDGTFSGDGVAELGAFGELIVTPDKTPDGAIVAQWTSPGDTPTPRTVTVDAPILELVVNENTTDRIVEGSLVLGLGNARYYARQGNLYRDPSLSDGAGTFAGTVNYDTWDAAIREYDGGLDNRVVVVSLLTEVAPATLQSVHARTPGAPIRPSGMSLTATTVGGNRLFVSSNDLGQFGGGGSGAVDFESGVYHVTFNDSVIASSVTINCVVYSSLPQNAELIGIDPVRLPADGKVVIFRRGDLLVVFDEHSTDLPALAPGASYDTGFVHISRVSLVDSDGQSLTVGSVESPADGDHVRYDDLAGRIDVPDDADLSGFVVPFWLSFQYDDLAIANEVEINGRISLGGALGNSYGTTAKVASAVQFTDLGARATDVFDLRTWSNSWSDTPGEAATGTYNTGTYPIQVDNIGAIEQRWSVSFASASAVRVIGEDVGVIAEGLPITEDIAPINPVTGTPYFVIQKDGWGGGWGAGNALRFRTTSAQVPIWLVRTVTPGALSHRSDKIALQLRGNAA